MTYIASSSAFLHKYLHILHTLVKCQAVIKVWKNRYCPSLVPSVFFFFATHCTSIWPVPTATSPHCKTYQCAVSSCLSFSHTLTLCESFTVLGSSSAIQSSHQPVCVLFCLPKGQRSTCADSRPTSLSTKQLQPHAVPTGLSKAIRRPWRTVFNI